MTDREIMQQALDAMEKYQVKSGDFDRFDDVIKNLRQALAQPEQEPVAWMVRDQVDGCRYPSASKNPAGSINGESQPLYTAPPKLAQPEQEELIQFKNGKWSYVRKPWVGLTDDEIEKIVDLNTSDDGGFDIWCDGIAVAHIVCAKLKEKNA